MNTRHVPTTAAALRVLSGYTGAASLEEALQDPRGVRLLWLEILVNDRLNLEPWMNRPEVQEAYAKACRWYTTYRSLISAVLVRAPLPRQPGPVDFREYRVFAEALRFAADHN
jgi:hypothetical protein